MSHHLPGHRETDLFVLANGDMLMSVDSSALCSVSWRDCCPWLLLCRTFRLAVGIQVLLSASLGAVATSAGWHLSSRFFVEAQDLEANPTLHADVDYLSRWPGQRRGSLPPWIRGISSGSDGWRNTLGVDGHAAPAVPIVSVVYRFVQPVRRLFDMRSSPRVSAFYLFGALWTLVVWAFLGAVITRIAAVSLGREERISLRDAAGHARRKWRAHIAAPLLPLLGVVALALPMAGLGWCMRMDLGVLLGGLLWLPVLLGGFLMMVLLLGLLFGWPLMWSTIETEGSDAFDAISRAYAYTFQRPLQYLFYTLVAGLCGLLGWLLVWGTSEAVVTLGFWGTGWGAGASRVAAIQADADWGARALAKTLPADSSEPASPQPPAAAPKGAAGQTGVFLIGLAIAFVRILANAYAYSFFWCAAAGIYLLLRRDADNTEMDDVYLEDEGETVYGLPPLRTDEAGVPAVDDQDESSEP